MGGVRAIADGDEEDDVLQDVVSAARAESAGCGAEVSGAGCGSTGSEQWAGDGSCSVEEEDDSVEGGEEEEYAVFVVGGCYEEAGEEEGTAGF